MEECSLMKRLETAGWRTVPRGTPTELSRKWRTNLQNYSHLTLASEMFSLDAHRPQFYQNVFISPLVKSYLEETGSLGHLTSGIQILVQVWTKFYLSFELSGPGEISKEH